MRLILLIISSWLVAFTCFAADLTVVVKTPAGQPLRDAVVSIDQALPPGASVHVDWPLRMAQENIQFTPFVLVAPVGAEVSFPNRDMVRHHVYSFSATKKFELKLYGRDETRSVKFDKAGVVALGCNIHDQMVGFIKVVDTPFAAASNGDGVVVLHGVPTGSRTLRVWHPYAKAPKNEISQSVTIKDGQTRVEIVLDARPGPAPQHGDHGGGIH